MYEHRGQPVLPWQSFRRRMMRHGGYAGVIVLVSTAFGMAGYHWVAGYRWIDAFLNSAMLLGGMGPVGDIPTGAGKLFAGFFALYAGLVFLGVAGLLLAPVFHRMMHRFHVEAEHRTR